MNIKFYIYILVIPLMIWTVMSLNLERYFKKGHTTQIKIFYITISLIFAYLLVNFLYDFYSVSAIV